MKPCCSLLTPLSPGEAREAILRLADKGEEGPVVRPRADEKSLRVRWRSRSAGKPLLGFPEWQLDFSSGSLGTIVDFRWIFPWARSGLLLTLLVLTGVIFEVFSPGPGLIPVFFFLGLVFFTLTVAGHFRTRRGKSWKALKALVKETVQGC